MSRDSNKSSTVLKAFQVLETVANLPAPATAPEIARISGIERVTTYRLLKTIAHAGYIELDESTKTYRVSRRMLSLARPVLNGSADRNLIERMLVAISARTGETCHYSELSGEETVLTQRSKGKQLVAVDFNIGNRGDLHATSVGKVIMAYQSAEFVDNYFEKDLKAHTPKTVVNKDAMLQQLENIRENGIAFDFEELATGMNCVAVPVPEPIGTVKSGISISGPSIRLTAERLQELAQVMKEEIAKAI